MCCCVDLLKQISLEFLTRPFFFTNVEHIFQNFDILIAERRCNMLKELNNAMEYIEVHLEDEFLLEKISEHINVSDYHFRKIFLHLLV